jgi:type IV secretion system protein VirB10
MFAFAALAMQGQESVALPKPGATPPAAAAAPAVVVPVATTPPVPAGPPKMFHVDRGTKIPVSMINSISTKTAQDGEKVYLETVFPILSAGKVVIPPGSYVSGTVTNIKRPGRVKGRGEFYLRFDAITLPNGVTRDFRANVGSLDGRASEELDKTEGKIKSEGDKTGDAVKVGEVTMIGTGIGSLAGQAAGSLAKGSLIGAGAGAAAGLAMVLLTRGPDAVLAKGTTLEMVLERPLQFEEPELDFTNSMPRPSNSNGGGPLPSRRANNGLGLPGTGSRVPSHL